VLRDDAAREGQDKQEEEGLFFLSHIGGTERLKDIPETIQSAYELMRAQDRDLILRMLVLNLNMAICVCAFDEFPRAVVTALPLTTNEVSRQHEAAAKLLRGVIKHWDSAWKCIFNRLSQEKKPMKDASMAIESAFSRSDRHSKLENMRGYSMHPVLTGANVWMFTEHGTGSSFYQPLSMMSALETADLFYRKQTIYKKIKACQCQKSGY
jgi:hypothetical protein